MPGHRGAARRQRPAPQQRAAVHQGCGTPSRAAAAAGRRTAGVRRPGRPSTARAWAACHEKWHRLSTCAPAPVIQPSIQARPAGVVAGLVVRVGPGVRRVAGAGLDVQGQAGQLHRLVEAALLLPHEREQPGEPPVVAVRRRAPLDDLQASWGTVVTPAKAIVGTATESSRASVGCRRRCRTSGPESPATCRATASTWLRSRSVLRRACSRASRTRASVSTGAQSSWPSSASAACPSANVGSRATEAATACSAPSSSAEQVAHPAVVGGDRLHPAGERQAVPVHTSHVSTLNN